MSNLTGRWIRKNKNVQVHRYGSKKDDNGIEIVMIGFRNGHTKFLNIDQFMSEFVELKPLVEEITKDVEWISKRDDRQYHVCELMHNQGTVKYRCNEDPDSIHYRCNIGQFKNMFKLESVEETA